MTDPAADGRLIGELLRVPAQAVVGQCHRAFVAAGHVSLRPAHMSVLQHIDHPPHGTRITELAERAQITKQSMGEVVAALERHGYVERVPDPTDGRAKIVRLTDRGWAAHEEAGEIVKRLEDDWAERLGRQKFDHLRTLLKELIATLGGGASGPPAPAERATTTTQDGADAAV
jgi:DNA-binding MarR family transcriptional regulator